MNMGRRIIFDVVPMGHNSLSADFIYLRGVQAPHVIGRERGIIPGCIPGDIHMFHTHAETNEWLNYICPNASHYPPKQAELVERKPIDDVRERTGKMADQYEWAVQSYVKKEIRYDEAMRYMGTKEVL